jgi:hypothetical protein
MCAEALWIQEIKPLFNSMKIFTIVFEFAMYSLELEIKFKKKLFPTHLPYFFSTTLAETRHFFSMASIEEKQYSSTPLLCCQNHGFEHNIQTFFFIPLYIVLNKTINSSVLRDM